MKQKSAPINDPDLSKVLSFRQPANIDVKAVAKKAGTTINGLLRAALLEYMERNQLAS
ncbi:hypothetical protein [Nostoc sp. DSM 114167]|jgi:hypothetical protein|uniref:hypothetical protein n=1 Tax=Nostoc sp. DSM 114167 TaxID=3439050 RepID=UPI004045A24F